MKALILAASLVMPSAAPAAPAEPDSRKEICADFASLAHTTMLAHQEGLPLQRVLIILDANYTDYPEDKAYAKAIAADAYDSPRYHTEGAQERAAADFRDRVHVECLQ